MSGTRNSSLLRKLTYATLIPVALALGAREVRAATHYIPADYNSIQVAINDPNVRAGDRIIVYPGTYIENINFRGKNIILRSTDPNDPNIVATTIIDGNQNGSVATFNSGEDVNCVLSGFTITNGYVVGDFEGDGGGIYCYASRPMITNCNINWNMAKPGWDWGGRGGGIYSKDGNPTINNCAISNNYAILGGGIWCYNSSPIINNCITDDNSGGGIFLVYYSNPVLTYCTISGNTNIGIDIYYYSNPTLISCTITGNSANAGGGISSRCYSRPILTDCTISDNTAQKGGGIYCDDSSPTIGNCIITGNSANYGGGIYSSYYGNLTMTNCTFVSNSATGGNALCCDSYGLRFPSDVQLANCILWDGGNEILNIDDSAITITYSDVQGDWLGEGNIDVDPLFADPSNNNYHLKSQGGRYDPTAQAWIYDEVTSPCIDAGDPMSPIGPEPFPNAGVVNMGAYGGTTEASKSYFGKPPCEIIVAGDVNGDCIVNFLDFRLMALHWCEDNNP